MKFRDKDRSLFWEGRDVVITGINGFIGGNLTKALVDKGAVVTGLDVDLNTGSFLFYEGLNSRCKLIEGDVTDEELMMHLLSERHGAVIFHLAAQVEVGVALEHPYPTWETNIRGTYTLMEGVRKHSDKIGAVIVASSDKAYGPYELDKLPYREDYPLQPRYPYDTSKACADMIAQSYANEIYNLPVIVTRFANIFGPGQKHMSALVPDSIASALKIKQFIPRGDGRQIRDFLYVDDVVDLYLRIGVQLSVNAKDCRGHIFNAGTNSAHAVRDVIEMVYTLCDNRADFSEVLSLMSGKKTTGEIDCQYMNYDKVNRYFGWSPAHRLEDGLRKTIEWYKNYHARK